MEPQPDGQYLQLVISASYDLVPRSRQEIIDLCLRELADVLPATREAKLEKATVIKEMNATFSPEPGVDRWRPGQDIGREESFSRGRLDSDGLAGHDGRSRAQRISGRGERCSTQFGQPRKFCSRICQSKDLCKIWAEKQEK